MNNKKIIMFVFGTRPEAIKLAPLILALNADGNFRTLICSTGQHREMLKPLFNFFGLRVDYDLDLMKPGQNLVDISIGVLQGLQKITSIENPNILVAQGDTTSCFIASLFGFYQKIPVLHIEAGLRSGNIHSPFPEEFNRRVTAFAADLHFAPTPGARQNLVSEGFAAEKIFVTGNTGIDALFAASEKLDADQKQLLELEDKFGFLDKGRKLILVTLHRRESFGEPMREVMKGLLSLSNRADLQILIPLHLNPEVQSAAREVFGNRAKWGGKVEELSSKSNIFICEPQEYISFLFLMRKAYLIVTDSGGVQEEAPSLGKPILVARENTERPEAIEAGTSRLVPLTADGFEKSVLEVLESQKIYDEMANAQNPFGDGKACEKIIAIVKKQYLD